MMQWLRENRKQESLSKLIYLRHILEPSFREAGHKTFPVNAESRTKLIKTARIIAQAHIDHAEKHERVGRYFHRDMSRLTNSDANLAKKSLTY